MRSTEEGNCPLCVSADILLSQGRIFLYFYIAGAISILWLRQGMRQSLCGSTGVLLVWTFHYFLPICLSQLLSLLLSDSFLNPLTHKTQSHCVAQGGGKPQSPTMFTPQSPEWLGPRTWTNLLREWLFK